MLSLFPSFITLPERVTLNHKSFSRIMKTSIFLLQTTQASRKKKIKGTVWKRIKSQWGKKDTYSDVDSVRNEKFTHHLKAIKVINLPPKNQSGKKQCSNDAQLYVPTLPCMHVWQRWGVLLMRMRQRIISSQIWTRASLSFSSILF